MLIFKVSIVKLHDSGTKQVQTGTKTIHFCLDFENAPILLSGTYSLRNLAKRVQPGRIP